MAIRKIVHLDYHCFLNLLVAITQSSNCCSASSIKNSPTIINVEVDARCGLDYQSRVSMEVFVQKTIIWCRGWCYRSHFDKKVWEEKVCLGCSRKHEKPGGVGYLKYGIIHYNSAYANVLGRLEEVLLIQVSGIFYFVRLFLKQDQSHFRRLVQNIATCSKSTNKSYPVVTKDTPQEVRFQFPMWRMREMSLGSQEKEKRWRGLFV